MYKEVEISPIEATAYWWIKTIKNKVKEIDQYKSCDKNEIKFAQVFSDFTELDWRDLYLELVKYITEDVNSYVPIKTTIGIDAFNQDTCKSGHNKLNVELKSILKKTIPNIRLAGDSYKDSVIYTNMFGASVWYKSCGVYDLSTKYDYNYILTGDCEYLDLYKQIIAIIVVLKSKNEDFNSVSLLRNVFCEEYNDINNSSKELEEIYEKFNYVFDKICENGEIIGASHKESYRIGKIDSSLLDGYMGDAHFYVDAILNKKNSGNKKYIIFDKDDNRYQKKLKK